MSVYFSTHKVGASSGGFSSYMSAHITGLSFSHLVSHNVFATSSIISSHLLLKVIVIPHQCSINTQGNVEILFLPLI